MPYWRLFYHLVWATKDRLPLIGDHEETRIARSFTLTVADLGAQSHAVGFMPDHVHVVVSAPPKIAPAELVRRLKGAASHDLNLGRTMPDRFVWQREYGVLSFGERALPQVVDYVRHQRERHAAGPLWPTMERMDEE